MTTIWELWKRRYNKNLREQIRAAHTRFPPPSSAFTHQEKELMDRFVIRGYIPFPAEPFAQSDVKSGRIRIESDGATVFEETKDFPVNAGNSDWDLAHPDVVNANREPYLTAPGGATGQPFLRLSNVYEAPQGLSGTLRTFNLDDATPPNPTEGEPVNFTVVDNVPPSAPTSAFLHSEGEINVPDAPPEEPPPEEPPVEEPPVEDPPVEDPPAEPTV